MPSLRGKNDNNGFYSSLLSNWSPPTRIAFSTNIAHLRLWLPLPLKLPTSGKDRPPPTDACRALWGGRTIGHDGAVRQRLKLTSLAFRTRWVIQKAEKETPWLTGLEGLQIFLWISSYFDHDHDVISVINVIDIPYDVQKKMHYLKLVQGGEDVNLLREKYRCSHLNGSSTILLVTDSWKKKEYSFPFE